MSTAPKVYSAHYKNDEETVVKLKAWRQGVVNRLRSLFDAPELEMDYDMDRFEFRLRMPGREPFGLDQLSDGFSAVIQVVAEILMRMEAHAPGRYDLPGLVLIDEVETHLHVELQKQILPFLTDFFPNLQLIVTSHSPFVLTSLMDCVIYDLDLKKRWENLAPLSASTVIEQYFESDLYSAASAESLRRYEALSSLPMRNAEEQVEHERLRLLLDSVAVDQAPELVAEYRYINARQRERATEE